MGIEPTSEPWEGALRAIPAACYGLHIECNLAARLAKP
jgi:hypothetical protein